MKKWRISIYACELETEEENNVARIETERDEVNDRLSHRWRSTAKVFWEYQFHNIPISIYKSSLPDVGGNRH